MEQYNLTGCELILGNSWHRYSLIGKHCLLRSASQIQESILSPRSTVHVDEFGHSIRFSRMSAQRSWADDSINELSAQPATAFTVYELFLVWKLLCSSD